MIDNVLNIAILREPVNWLVVWTMLLVAWFLFEFVSNHSLSPITVDNS